MQKHKDLVPNGIFLRQCNLLFMCYQGNISQIFQFSQQNKQNKKQIKVLKMALQSFWAVNDRFHGEILTNDHLVYVHSVPTYKKPSYKKPSYKKHQLKNFKLRNETRGWFIKNETHKQVFLGQIQCSCMQIQIICQVHRFIP